MITTVAALLQELQAKEAAKLATRDLLDRAIPSALNLRIVEGFVEDHEGNLSPQIDAMLVTGDGRQIPHTASFVWPVQKVIAVLEVKKR